jgi:hypothetical protein
MGLFGGFDKARLKAHLAMAVQRLRLNKNKKTNEIAVERKSVADLVRRTEFGGRPGAGGCAGVLRAWVSR